MGNFSNTLKALRRQHGMTQLELSQKLNLSLSTVRNWEQGLHVPRYPTMKLLADVFGVSMLELTALDDFDNLERVEDLGFDDRTISEALEPVKEIGKELAKKGIEMTLLHHFRSLNNQGKLRVAEYALLLNLSGRFNLDD